jgi:hypothetical protein
LFNNDSALFFEKHIGNPFHAIHFFQIAKVAFELSLIFIGMEKNRKEFYFATIKANLEGWVADLINSWLCKENGYIVKDKQGVYGALISQVVNKIYNQVVNGDDEKFADDIRSYTSDNYLRLCLVMFRGLGVRQICGEGKEEDALNKQFEEKVIPDTQELLNTRVGSVFNKMEFNIILMFIFTAIAAENRTLGISLLILQFLVCVYMAWNRKDFNKLGLHDFEGMLGGDNNTAYSRKIIEEPISRDSVTSFTFSSTSSCSSCSSLSSFVSSPSGSLTQVTDRGIGPIPKGKSKEKNCDSKEAKVSSSSSGLSLGKTKDFGSREIIFLRIPVVPRRKLIFHTDEVKSMFPQGYASPDLDRIVDKLRDAAAEGPFMRLNETGVSGVKSVCPGSMAKVMGKNVCELRIKLKFDNEHQEDSNVQAFLKYNKVIDAFVVYAIDTHAHENQQDPSYNTEGFFSYLRRSAQAHESNANNAHNAQRLCFSNT